MIFHFYFFSELHIFFMIVVFVENVEKNQINRFNQKIRINREKKSDLFYLFGKNLDYFQPWFPVVGGRGREDGPGPVCRGPHPPARGHLHRRDRLVAVTEDGRGTRVVTPHQDRVPRSTRE